MSQFMVISFFSAFFVILVLYIIGSFYAVRLRKHLTDKYPEKLKQTGIYGIKFANSLYKDWSEIKDTEIQKLKNKAKNFQSAIIIFLLSYCLFMFVILTIFALRKNT